MNIIFSEDAWEEYVDWQIDKKILKTLNNLIKEIQRTPYEGTGNPEQLKHELSGHWSRRINIKDRLVYKILEIGVLGEEMVYIASCKGHY